MKRPAWASSGLVRAWLAVIAIGLLVLTWRVAGQSFGAEATLSDGARAYATCKPPWRAARITPPAQRFTLWAMIGGTGELRDEGVAALGARCGSQARTRMAFSGVLFAGGAVLAWLAFPARLRR